MIVTITITPTTDRTGHVNPSPLEFTIYVVGPFNAAGTTAVALTNGVARVSDQSDTQINGHFTFTGTRNQPVTILSKGVDASTYPPHRIGEPVRRTISTQVVRLPSILIQMEAAAKLPPTSPDPVTLGLSFTSSAVVHSARFR